MQKQTIFSFFTHISPEFYISQPTYYKRFEIRLQEKISKMCENTVILGKHRAGYPCAFSVRWADEKRVNPSDFFTFIDRTTKDVTRRQQTGAVKKGGEAACRAVDREIMELFKGKREELDWRELEEYRDKIYAVADMAERAGFIRGFKYGAALMAECFAGDKSISKP